VVVELQQRIPHEAPFEASPADEQMHLAPGQIAGLSGLPGSGLTRVGISLLVPHAAVGLVAYIDVRGWANPAAAWEMGIGPDRLVVIRTSEIVSWGRVVATLLAGVKGVYAEVPGGVKDASLRMLAAKARQHQTPLVLRPLHGELPSGLAHLRLRARDVRWEGTEDGHGHLTRRASLLDASGKAIRGMERTIEVHDDGTNDLRVVSRVGAEAARRPA